MNAILLLFGWILIAIPALVAALVGALLWAASLLRCKRCGFIHEFEECEEE